MATATTPVHTEWFTTAWQLTWRRLLVAAAVGDLVAIVAFSIAARDPEAAAIGTSLAVGVALLRWRSGLAGRLLLAVLFADVLAWMALGTITNIVAGEPLSQVLVPGALSAISLVGFVAALVSQRRDVGPGATITVGVGVAVVAAAAIAAMVTPTSDDTAADLRVVADTVAFDQTTLTASAGQISVELDNRDLFWHTFTVDALEVDLAVPVGGDRQVTFNAEPGTYRFYCRIPGHETRMLGTLTVN